MWCLQMKERFCCLFMSQTDIIPVTPPTTWLTDDFQLHQ